MNGTTTNGAAASIAIGGAQIREVAARAIVWLWHQLVCDGQIVVLFGAPGSGKTTLLFPDARRRTRVERRGRCARATRRARARRQVRRADRRRARRSVAARKLVKTAEVLGIDRQEVDPLDRVILIARKEVRVGSPKWEEIKQLIARGLVADLFIDSLARFGAGESNSEDDQADSFAEVSAAIEGAPSCTKATAWIIAHARKSADGGVEGLSGSTQRAAQADTILFVKATTDDNDQVCSSRVTAPKLRGEPDEPFKAVDFTIAKNEAGRWSCTLDGASKRTEKQAPAHERVHTLLATAPEPMTKSAMRDALGMSGKVIEEAITALFATKQITRVGEGKGARFAAKTKGIESAHGIARATSVVGVLPRSRRRTTDEPAPDNTRRRCPLDTLRTRHFRCPVSGAVPSGNRGRNDDRTRPLHRTGRTTGSQKGIRCPVRRFFQSARRADRRALRQREARAAKLGGLIATRRAERPGVPMTTTKATAHLSRLPVNRFRGHGLSVCDRSLDARKRTNDASHLPGRTRDVPLDVEEGRHRPRIAVIEEALGAPDDANLRLDGARIEPSAFPYGRFHVRRSIPPGTRLDVPGRSGPSIRSSSCNGMRAAVARLPCPKEFCRSPATAAAALRPFPTRPAGTITGSCRASSSAPPATTWSTSARRWKSTYGRLACSP